MCSWKLPLKDMPSSFQITVLAVVFFLASVLYASVGHGGASANLATMALAGIAPVMMKPTARVLNIFVSALGLFLFCRAGHWKGRFFWPLAATSIPAAFLGGWMHVSDPVFKLVLACALAFASWWLPAVLAGGAIGGFWGSRSAPPVILRRCLAAALAVAAIKFAVI